MSQLNFLIDGAPVHEFDLQTLKTQNAVQQWRDTVMDIWRAANPELTSTSIEWDVHDTLAGFALPRTIEIDAEIEARKITAPSRNLDLIVRRGEYSTYSETFNKMSAGEVFGLLECFDNAMQMTEYTFDAYDTLGDEECDRQVIETLNDMFGAEFGIAFDKRKNHLIAREELVTLYAERQRLDALIAKQEALL